MLYWFRWEKEHPDQQDLPRYIQLSTSSRVDFITHLTIHRVWMFRASDLMALAEMPNLGILELSDLFGGQQEERDFITPDIVDSLLSDRLVRGWSEKDNPFPNLRILMMTSIHSSVTLLALQYASRFPSLVYCVLKSISLSQSKHGIRQRAADLGWRLEKTLQPWRGRDPEIVPAETIRWRLESFDRHVHDGVFISRCQPADSEAHMPNEAPLETLAEDKGVVDQSLQISRAKGLHDSWPWVVWNLYGTLGEQIGNADVIEQGVDLPHRATHIAPRMGCERSPKRISINEEQDPCDLHELLPPKQMLSVVLGWYGDYYPDVEDRRYRPGDCFGFCPSHEVPPGEAPVKLKSYTFVRDYNLNMSTSTKSGGVNTANTTVSAETGSSQEAGLSSTSTKRTEAGGAATFRPRKRRNLNDLFSYGAESKEDGTL
ncbi:hypothetical protein CONLIGDRAFT_474126 [Coniochaeta ligniaria NRRL 30616]|uniref:Uncharacterized protein n=1 Tax=Coniochaeta ligniaria NRRL 30616 TaxID=1408157 RepID=A0A1J7IFK5_9PEZI|nr:hypothetical protein CONLIGDRAFT_474126 [Coniochaeta ligniaria NRRL 30616]